MEGRRSHLNQRKLPTPTGFSGFPWQLQHPGWIGVYSILHPSQPFLSRAIPPNFMGSHHARLSWLNPVNDFHTQKKENILYSIRLFISTQYKCMRFWSVFIIFHERAVCYFHLSRASVHKEMNMSQDVLQIQYQVWTVSRLNTKHFMYKLKFSVLDSKIAKLKRRILTNS